VSAIIAAIEFLEDYRIIPLALVLITVCFLMSSLWRRQRKGRQGKRNVIPARNPSPASSRGHLQTDLEELLVELQELSRKISADIDTRFAKLEAAIRDADRRIAVLNRLEHRLAERTGQVAAGIDDFDVRHAVIYELADAGYSPVQIAKELGKTPGEVELILNLRKQSDN